MKKFIATALLIFVNTGVQANDAQQIVDTMSTVRPLNILHERFNTTGVNSEAGIIKVEHVFVNNGIRYTVWNLDWYDNTDRSDELRVYYRVNGTDNNDRSNVFSVSLDDPENIHLSHHYTDGTIDGYRTDHYGKQEITKIDAMNEIKDHLNIIYQAYKIE